MVFVQSVPHNVIPSLRHAALVCVALTVLCGLLGQRAEAMPLTPPQRDTHGITDRIYCSNSLSEAIRVICGGRFNSYTSKYPESVGSRSLKSATTLKSVAYNGQHGTYQPLQSGPIHECCMRPCGYSDLKMYCAP